MIKVNKNDNIFDIISNIKKNKKNNKKIILFFPFGHNILYNKVALISLKKAFPENKIIINTKDILSKKIIKKSGLKYSLIKDFNFIEDKDLLKYNYNFFEYLSYEIKKNINFIKNKIFKNKKNIDPRKKFLKYYKQKTNIKIFILILIISLLMFSYVFIFVLNKTNVYITPDIQVKTKVKNFTFKQNLDENNLNKNYIKLKEFNKTISLNEKIFTTGIEQKEKYRATGKVTIINKYPSEIKLKSNTRLLSQSGIIYQTKRWITIPKAIKNKNNTLIPGTKEIEVIASLRDKKGQITGARGNTTEDNVKLIIPGLNTEDRKNIYAIVSGKITGGQDKFEKIVGKYDLENAKKIFTENLKKEAIKQIQKEIDLHNKNSNQKYQILNIDNIYKFTNLEIKLPKINISEKKEYFYISGIINVKTYAFNKNSILSKLKKEIETNILKNKEKILFIDNKSIGIFSKKGIIYRKENPLEIKATIAIEYNTQYNFLNENDNYINKLKQTISGIPKDIAEKKLINENKISNAKIEIRPFFIDKVSSYLNNIEFIIEK